MPLHVEATYDDGVLKLDKLLPLDEKQRVHVVVHPRPSRAEQSYGLLKWTGPVEVLEYIAESPDLDPAERYDDLQ